MNLTGKLTEQAIIKHLKAVERFRHSKDIAQCLGIPHRSVRYSLGKLLGSGIIERKKQSYSFLYRFVAGIPKTMSK